MVRPIFSLIINLWFCTRHSVNHTKLNLKKRIVPDCLFCLEFKQNWVTNQQPSQLSISCNWLLSFAHQLLPKLVTNLLFIFWILCIFLHPFTFYDDQKLKPFFPRSTLSFLWWKLNFLATMYSLWIFLFVGSLSHKQRAFLGFKPYWWQIHIHADSPVGDFVTWPWSNLTCWCPNLSCCWYPEFPCIFDIPICLAWFEFYFVFHGL